MKFGNQDNCNYNIPAFSVDMYSNYSSLPRNQLKLIGKQNLECTEL